MSKEIDLLPVDTHCEWLSKYGWIGGKVVGHDGRVTVVSHNDGYTGCHPHEVRQISRSSAVDETP